MALGQAVDTDKVSTHAYEVIYGKYFEPDNVRLRVRKILEIGLGCNMAYGPGHSVMLWKRYFPNAEIWMADYDAACVKAYSQNLTALGVRVVTGDQADLGVLQSWVATTGGGFDVIIDDGGHTNMQMYNSFMVLFLHALNPGGVYIIEDMQLARAPAAVDGDKQHIMIEVVKDWMEALVLDPGDDGVGDLFKLKFGLPPTLKTIDCSRACCAFTKCLKSDKRCDNPRFDMSLMAYGKNKNKPRRVLH